MSLILHIDTATSVGSVCLSKNGQVLQTLVNEKQQDHAASMTLFIKEVMQQQGIVPGDLDAVAVSAGPGSYTGLRVGVATAKGLCYTWEKPLIAVSTLQMMAQGVLTQTQDNNALYCPMLDARRMEVYTAIYDGGLNVIVDPHALILTPDAFGEQISKQKIYFFGNGSDKWQQLMTPNEHALFIPYILNAADMVPLATAAYEHKSFEDVAYFSPFYLKPFHSTIKK
ncbi:tRNA (adenosine(37)-N6)-threonylcarbamoyltransferase complex dimerization subunit type 1 TsaB [Chitinophaga rhizophila]|uniref:N(6)-L-threonylcarbamoyladenine synthase n=1 Tax=Chitinophaga rhizophila TaxID=2866212 RepID=A0ABS7GGC1_9BACT|nr:tRNA (adenosine(37)-N6)-threonylcarbamoyltransferase complex dimerization subunit type 1 TsaB [Chitinophaga rhizophila]MBW8686295.1 tRNA (adenosine(37)-N6)-threonylcarbamoyltransferase complex dimerization subunit type 1 TsaB [Chitinophaga rhizophila]